MGIDTNLITKTTNDFASDFICSVCKDLLEIPVTLVKCQHSFCRECLNRLSRLNRFKSAGQVEAVNCPDCQTEFSPTNDIVEPYRIMKQVMSRIQLTCPYAECDAIVGYDDFNLHLEHCDSAPTAIETCAHCTNEYQKTDAEKHKGECLPLLQSLVMELSRKLKINEESEKRLKSQLKTKSSPIIQLPEGIKLTTKSKANIQGDEAGHNFVATLKLASPTAFDETDRNIENGFDWYVSSSAGIRVEGGIIRVQHQCRKYDHEDSVSSNYVGLAVTLDDAVEKIDAKFKMKVWENLKFANGTMILDKDWVTPTFSHNRDSWGHNVKKPKFVMKPKFGIETEIHYEDLAPEVTVSLRIRQWNTVKKIEGQHSPVVATAPNFSFDTQGPDQNNGTGRVGAVYPDLTFNKSDGDIPQSTEDDRKKSIVGRFEKLSSFSKKIFAGEKKSSSPASRANSPASCANSHPPTRPISLDQVPPPCNLDRDSEKDEI